MNKLDKIINSTLIKYFNSIEMIEEVQNQILMNIIKDNSKTVYGKQHDFQNIKNREDFEEKVPINNYNDLKQFIERSKYEENVILKGPISYWAMTSGSSGVSKYIPHTKESLNLWNQGALRSIAGFIQNKPDTDLLKYKHISIVGPALIETINSIPVGYISGISTIKNDYNLTTDSINKISNYQEKMQKIFELSIDNPISVFNGITTFTINFINYVYENGYEMAKSNPSHLEKILPCLNEDRTVNVNKLWPHLKVCISSGVDINLCRDRMLKLLPDIWISNFYTGIEGAYAFSTEACTDRLYLNYDLYYYEFRDVVSGKIYNLNKKKKNLPCELIITSCNGLYRYTNGDLIQFVSLKPPIIKVLGRSNVMINISGEKLNDCEINDCVDNTLKQLKFSINGYCFFGWLGDDGYVHHCIVMEVNEGQVNIEDISTSLFENLKEINMCIRSVAPELFKAPHVIILKKATFSELEKNISNKKGIVGHSKIKHIYDYDEIKQLIHREYSEDHNVPLNIIDGFISTREMTVSI